MPFLVWDSPRGRVVFEITRSLSVLGREPGCEDQVDRLLRREHLVGQDEPALLGRECHEDHVPPERHPRAVQGEERSEVQDAPGLGVQCPPAVDEAVVLQLVQDRKLIGLFAAVEADAHIVQVTYRIALIAREAHHHFDLVLATLHALDFLAIKSGAHLAGKIGARACFSQ